MNLRPYFTDTRLVLSAAFVVVLAGLGLWAEGTAATIPECGNRWGYIVKDASTCERDPMAYFAMICGVGVLVALSAVVSNVRAVRRDVETRQLFSSYR